ncbi:transmembrane protease serine 9-like isoform X2 [Sabethes cyaneus]|uniref:transmembrane protease serine 9-like isoform X2 n=1 Tax=Sabethes cyaneus TaxID=53552 RepID=UPI00237E4451|nr:transmembrane protease serine 9-like isoform X2 [Sabethes cyaneus]
MKLSFALFMILILSQLEALQVQSDQYRHQCGQRPIQSVGVITAGRATYPGEFPWHAAIYRVQLLGSSYVCGGFLISDRIVATAAHCVTDQENGFLITAGGVSVRLGMFELLTVSRNTQEHRVGKIYRHENYTASSYRHDIALLVLQTVVEFNAYVQPICLWDVQRFGGGFELTGVVSGWGLTEYDVLANVLKSAKLPMVSFLECLQSDRDLFSQILYEGMFCAGLRNGTSVCNGDSGGAFAINVNGTWIARGIISFTGLREHTASLCNAHSYAGFVNVASYLQWIEKITNQDGFVIAETFGANNSSVEPITISSTVATFNSSERIKCAEYENSNRNNRLQDLSYLTYVAKDTPFSRVIDCFAIVISERYLISTADCRSLETFEKSAASAQFVVVETEDYTLRHEIKSFHQYPAFARTPSEENNLALIELERNISIPTGQFVCLWSGNEPDMGKIFLYSAAKYLSRRLRIDPTTDKSSKCFNQLIAPSLMIQNSDGESYRLVGVVVNATCSKIRFVKLSKFIPWIERLVWG